MDIYGFIMIACCIVFMKTRSPQVAMFIIAVFFTCLALSFYFGSFAPVENEWLKISFALFALSLWLLNVTRYILSVISSSANDNAHSPKG